MIVTEGAVVSVWDVKAYMKVIMKTCVFPSPCLVRHVYPGVARQNLELAEAIYVLERGSRLGIGNNTGALGNGYGAEAEARERAGHQRDKVRVLLKHMAYESVIDTVWRQSLSIHLPSGS